MTRVDSEILKLGLTDSQVIRMTSKFNTTWSRGVAYNFTRAAATLHGQEGSSSSSGEKQRVTQNLFNIK